MSLTERLSSGDKGPRDGPWSAGRSGDSADCPVLGVIDKCSRTCPAPLRRPRLPLRCPLQHLATTSSSRKVDTDRSGPAVSRVWPLSSSSSSFPCTSSPFFLPLCSEPSQRVTLACTRSLRKREQRSVSSCLPPRLSWLAPPCAATTTTSQSSVSTVSSSPSIAQSLRLSGATRQGLSFPWWHLLFPRWISHRLLLCLVTLFAIISSNHRVLSDRNRFYHISALCLRERVHPLYKKIDGAVISSKSENNLDCTITFQTDTILQKFMLRFEKLALDCNDHLYIYDGAHTHGNHKAHLSCRSTRAEVGTIYTAGNFLTLHYTTDAYSKADNGFRLIITAYKDSKNYCREHRCTRDQFCIARDLVCDGVNHCADNSDEFLCQEYEEADTIIGLEPMFFITIVIGVFILCLGCVVSVSLCLCRRERLLQRQQQRIALQQQYTSHQLLDTTHTGATPILQHNNSYNSKLDGCTMITSLDGYGATRNGGLVNSFTHTTLPSNHIAGANFATLPHLHHNHAQVGSPQMMNSVATHAAAAASSTGGQQQVHVRFGTLPVRGNDAKPPPPYPGNYFNNNVQASGQMSVSAVMVPVNGGPPVNGGNGILSNGSNGGLINMHTPPHSSQQNAVAPVQTQVIYTAK